MKCGCFIVCQHTQLRSKTAQLAQFNYNVSALSSIRKAANLSAMRPLIEQRRNSSRLRRMNNCSQCLLGLTAVELEINVSPEHESPIVDVPHTVISAVPTPLHRRMPRPRKYIRYYLVATDSTFEIEQTYIIAVALSA